MPKNEYGKNYMSTARNLKEIVNIANKTKNIKSLSPKQLVAQNKAPNLEEANKIISQLALLREKFTNDYQKLINGYQNLDWGVPDQTQSKETMEEFQKTHANVVISLDNFAKYAEMYGTPASKDYISSLKWASNAINTDTMKIRAYKGLYPTTISAVTKDAVVDLSPVSREDFRGHLTSFKNIAKALNVPSGLHRNSKEFTALAESVNSFIKDYENLAKGQGNLSDNFRFHIEQRITEIQEYAQDYIKAKGGVGNQRSQMGKDRMSAAVDVLSLTEEIHSHYPGYNNMSDHRAALRRGHYDYYEGRKELENTENYSYPNSFRLTKDEKAELESKDQIENDMEL